ncbi:dihydrolipoamide dehydrogenase [Methylohalomonas lacus]|uniref:Dihydrolipoyl dehydrogenase n=1 Tax=Methylohalomonas lacus TaxID=398773 RepID=A0AAE3HHV2_9GAMM|nr:dihydrolipoyl dehydrogenase [Methylohalomonas lacus]MCS3902569.1 dihydrolipoamide dehydrogenase [Methylohalomonas lacus]
MKSGKTWLLILIIAAVVLGYFYFGLDELLTLEYLKSRLDEFRAYADARPLLVLGGFFLGYVIITAASLPGAAIMTLAAGALFGLATGVLLVSFASSIGATLAFLIARYLFRDSVQEKFGQRLKKINEGVAKDGALYLFTLRLVPAFPFFIINIVMALTPIKTWTFYWVSQVGMLAGTIVYVNAGTQIAQIQSTGDLLSIELIGAFVLLGIFPWIARGIINLIQHRRVYRGWQKPRHFDRNLIVIGAGSAGLVSAYIAAAVKAGVTLIERDKMGGDCLNTGCVPSKTLIRSARQVHELKQADQYGVRLPENVSVDFPAVMQRIRDVIGQIAPHDSVERYSELGVDCRRGNARLVSPWEVEISRDGTSERLTARSIIIATGGRPAVPPIPGIEETDYLTSDNLWQLAEKPQRLLVLGGGPIGCELAQSFARLGSSVTLVEMAPQLLPREDTEAAEAVRQALQADGVNLLLSHKAKQFTREEAARVLHTQSNDSEQRIEFDQVLVAVGRQGNTEGLDLESLDIETRDNGTLVLNDYLQTRYPNIYACGDVAGPYQFTHVAAHQAWFAAVNALFGFAKKFRADYSVIPAATFTAPELARVGLNEKEADEQGIDYEVTRYDISELDRAITEGIDQGFIKVLTARGSDRILGVTIVNAQAGELIAEYVLAMRHGLGLNKILGTIHAYPTMMEANKFAAGEWKRAHAPQGLLKLIQKFHAWRL